MGGDKGALTFSVTQSNPNVDILSRSNVNMTGDEAAAFVVGYMRDDADNWARLMELSGPSQIDGFVLTRYNNEQTIAGQTNDLSSGTKAITWYRPSVFGTTIKPNEVVAYVNNEAGTTTVTANTPTFDATNEYILGQNGSNSETFRGVMGEAVLAKRVPTAAERRSLQKYFERKWKLAIVDTPSVIFGSDVLAWYDANYPNSLFEDDAGTDYAEDGDSIAKWNDLSGNGLHLGQTTTRPVYDATAGYLSKPGIVFTAANTDFLTTGAVVDLSTLGVAGVAVFVCAQWSSSSGNGGRFFSITGTDTDLNDIDGYALYYKSDTRIAGSLANEVNSTHLLSLNRPHALFGAVFSGLAQVGVNNTRNAYAGGPATPAFVDNSTFRVGTDYAQSVFLDGVIHEIVVLKRNPTFDERARMTAYLRTKWDF